MRHNVWVLLCFSYFPSLLFYSFYDRAIRTPTICIFVCLYTFLGDIDDAERSINKQRSIYYWWWCCFNYHRGQATTLSKSQFPDGCHIVRNSNRSQPRATIKNRIFYRCNAIGNNYVSQTNATSKSGISNGCHTIGNGHGS